MKCLTWVINNVEGASSRHTMCKLTWRDRNERIHNGRVRSEEKMLKSIMAGNKTRMKNSILNCAFQYLGTIPYSILA